MLHFLAGVGTTLIIFLALIICLTHYAGKISTVMLDKMWDFFEDNYKE